jgi:hypothetical protein
VPLYNTNEIIILYITFSITFFFSLWELYDVSTTNPGYVAKGNLSRDEYFLSNNLIIIKGESIELKYCYTCKIKRPPRSFHCGICNRCITIHGNYRIKFYNGFKSIETIINILLTILIEVSIMILKFFI